MKKMIIEIVGWYGTVAIILAYALVRFGLLGANTAWYQILNVTGAVGIVIVSLTKRAYQPAVLNIVWTVIGLIALLKIFLS